jgi:hypothetical protein
MMLKAEVADYLSESGRNPARLAVGPVQRQDLKQTASEEGKTTFPPAAMTAGKFRPEKGALCLG